MTKDLEKLKCPIKLLYGLNDTQHKVEEGLSYKDVLGDKCRITGIPGVGNFAHMEDPGKVCGQLM